MAALLRVRVPSELRMCQGLKRFMSRSSAMKKPRVAVIGSGPAGFGISQFLLKNHQSMQINMIEKTPIPYGLVRYGVSPDHQDVKNCVHGYEKVAENSRFSFYGGVEVGKTISIDALMQVCDSIVLCHGAQEPMKLNVPGENLGNVFTAKEFVGWYNGEDEYKDVTPDLSGETAVIIGVGNVALDCARMLLKPTTELEETDITQSSLQNLKMSNIKNVILVGRRGPLQMACTRRELSEIIEIGDVRIDVSKEYFTEDIKQALDVKKLSLRKTQRLIKYLIKSTSYKHSNTNKTFSIRLLRTPIEIGGDNSIDSIFLQKNIVSGGDSFNPEIVGSDIVERIPCSLLITAIGYGNKVIDDRIPNVNGRVLTNKSRVDLPYPLYSCGWCRTGPKGVLADTLNDCLVTGKNMVENLESGAWGAILEKQSLDEILKRKNIPYFSWEHWKCIDAHEVEVGLKMGKIREKVISHTDMSDIAFSR